MSQPFDLDAAVGESAIESFRFTWGGQTFELPAVLALPVDRQLALIDAIESLADPSPNEIVGVLKLLIDDEMLARLSAAKPLSVQGLMALITAWMGSQGLAVGKSPASSASSASTAPRSKPTSRSGRARKTS